MIKATHKTTPYNDCGFSFEMSEACGHKPPFGRASRRFVVPVFSVICRFFVVLLSAATTICPRAATASRSRLSRRVSSPGCYRRARALPIADCSDLVIVPTSRRNPSQSGATSPKRSG
jgi:hypothetical protein